jgi:parallel beta-helix repeat protein
VNCPTYHNKYGIRLMNNSSNNSITNCTISGNSHGADAYGIYLYSSSNNTITHTTMNNNSRSVYLEDSSTNTLRGNAIYASQNNFIVSGTTLTHFIQDIDLSNTINGKPIYYLYQQSNLTLDGLDNISYLGLISCTNITVKNMDVPSVLLAGTTYSRLLNVSLSYNEYIGMYFFESFYNSIMNCDTYHCGIRVILLDHSNYNIITNSTVHYSGGICHGIYLDNSSDNVITYIKINNGYGIDLLSSSNNNTIRNITMNVDGTGIALGDAFNNSISDCEIYSINEPEGGNYGISVSCSSYNSFRNCVIHKYIDGVIFDGLSSYNVFENCTVYNNEWQAFTIYDCSYNTIKNCTIYNSDVGVFIATSLGGQPCFGNVITDCTIYNNSAGIVICIYSYDNIVYHNNLINNTQNAYDECSDTWDNGYPSGGNFWSDYTGVDEYSGPEQDIPGSDGIGDTPYIIQGYYGPNEIDRYPLMNPLGDDVIPPVTTHEFDGISGDNGWFVSNVTVTLNAIDISGVNVTMYKLDDGAWTTYIGSFDVTEEADHTLVYYSVDNLGNREGDKSVALKIDRTMPTIDFAVEKTGLSEWLLTATVSDETSGVARVEFYLNDGYLGAVTTAPYEWVVTSKGTAQAIVYDNAGNNANDTKPVSFDLDLNSQSATNNQVVSGSQSQSSPVGGQSQSICSTLQRLFNLR